MSVWSQGMAGVWKYCITMLFAGTASVVLIVGNVVTHLCFDEQVVLLSVGLMY